MSPCVRIECGPDTDLDILPGQEQVAVYCATLAHKVNNSFNNNCRFAQFWHPRSLHATVACTNIN